MKALIDPSAWAVDLTPLRVNRQYRLLFLGRLVSTLALGMLMVVLSVQTYELTRSSVQVALVNTVLGLATLAGSLAGGVLSDRVDRRRVILVSRALAVLGLVALALVASRGEPTLGALYLFAAWDGATGAAGATAFGAAVPAVVPATMLPATGALMALAVDLGAAVSPLAGGLVAGFGGPAVVYWLVAAISAGSWALLLALAPIPPGSGDEDETSDGAEPTSRPRWWGDLTEGMAFAGRDAVLSTVLVLGFLQILLASPHVLVPELVGDHLGGGSEGVGLVYSAASVGALLASGLSGWVPRVHRVGWTLGLVLLVASLGVACFGLAPSVLVAAVAMAFVGACDVIGEILRFTILAERTPDRLRGRVQSLWTAQVTVGDSLGGPVLSLAARVLGAPAAIAAGGLAAAAGTAVLMARPALRTLRRDPDPADIDDAPDPADPTGTHLVDTGDRPDPQPLQETR